MLDTRPKKKLTQPLKLHGGKFYTADWIISLMPKHLHFIEAFFGGGSVLLQKNPTGVSEVVNDIDGELMNFWRVLQNDADLAQFLRIIEAVPFSKVEWADSAEPSGDRIQRAAQFFVRCRQSRAGKFESFATLSKTRTRRGMNEQTSSWMTAIDGLPTVAARLKRVVILCEDAVDVIRREDGPGTLAYCDPPYLFQTRHGSGANSDYRFEMTEADHVELLKTLAQLKGHFLLSGYQSDLYDSWAQQHGWRRHEKRIDNKASSAKCKPIKVECVWTNF